jgi:hypothetical protein
MYPMVEQELTRQAELNARRAGSYARRLAEARAEHTVPNVQVAIREAQAADAVALAQLAELDSGTVPTGRVLVAEAAGKIRAAMAVDDGVLVADPFAATGPLVDLLRLRLQQLRRQHAGARRGRRGLLGALGQRGRFA